MTKSLWQAKFFGFLAEWLRKLLVLEWLRLRIFATSSNNSKHISQDTWVGLRETRLLSPTFGISLLRVNGKFLRTDYRVLILTPRPKCPIITQLDGKFNKCCSYAHFIWDNACNSIFAKNAVSFKVPNTNNIFTCCLHTSTRIFRSVADIGFYHKQVSRLRFSWW